MSFVAIRAGIKSVLDGLVAVTPTPIIKHVLNGEDFSDEALIPAFPCAEIVRINDEPSYFTNREDMHVYVFAINIYFKQELTNRAAVEMAAEAVVDELLQTFTNEANVNLSGVADGRIMPVSAQSSVTTWKGQQVRKEQIVIRARKIMDMD